MVSITESEHHEYRELKHKMQDIELLSLAALKQGVTNKNQEDCLYFILEKLTGYDRSFICLLIDVKPRYML